MRGYPHRLGVQLQAQGADKLLTWSARRRRQGRDLICGGHQAADILIRAPKSLERTLEEVCASAGKKHPVSPPSFGFGPWSNSQLRRTASLVDLVARCVWGSVALRTRTWCRSYVCIHVCQVTSPLLMASRL